MRTFIKRRRERRPWGRRLLGLAVVLVLLLVVGAFAAMQAGLLVFESASANADEVAGTDSLGTAHESGGEIEPNTFAPPTLVPDESSAPAPDSLTGTEPTAPPAGPPADSGARSDSSANSDGGSGAVATSAELTALRSQLIVPVVGVAPSGLIDSFDDARGTRRHDALDILAPRGTQVVSAAPGRLLRLFTSEAGGLMVYATDSTERFVLMYGHLDAYAPGLHDGMPLRRGQALGIVGTTGNAPADVPHLHFAIARNDDLSRWWTGTPVNPFALLSR